MSQDVPITCFIVLFLNSFSQTDPITSELTVMGNFLNFFKAKSEYKVNLKKSNRTVF